MAVEVNPVAAPTERTPRVVVDVPSQVDRWFERGTLAAGLTVLALLGLVGVFLFLRSRPALEETGILSFLTRSQWRTDLRPPKIGVLGLLSETVIVALIAVVIAVPLGTIAALFISEYASPRARRYLTGLVDLMAAVPALIFGLWGAYYLSPQIVPLSRWLSIHLNWIPFFKTDPDAPLVGSLFIAGIV